MYVNTGQYHSILQELANNRAALVAVSKTKPVEAIKELYDLGQRDFGENYVQELISKQELLPSGIRWHFIGHLQSNKVKYIASFIHLVHGVDSFKLLKEISRQAVKQNRTIDVLLQVHIATEETKFGLNEEELKEVMLNQQTNPLPGIRVRGLMGMASFSHDRELVRSEFSTLKSLFNIYFKDDEHILSMGMSGDYQLALDCGSNMVRIGSLIFGSRS